MLNETSITTLATAAAERHAEELEAMPHQLEAQVAGHPLLQALDLLVAELDHLSALDVDQMIVVHPWRLLISHATGAEVVARQDALALEQAHGPVDGR